MPTKPRRLQDLSDEELAAEAKRRRQANRPKKIRVFEMDEETFKKHFGESDEDDEEEEEDDDDDSEVVDDSRYFKSS